MKMKEWLFTSELKRGEFGEEDSKLDLAINAKYWRIQEKT